MYFFRVDQFEKTGVLFFGMCIKNSSKNFQNFKQKYFYVFEQKHHKLL